MPRRINIVVIEIAVLALWLGAALFFAAAVAPALFAVLPSRTLAGMVVGRLLPSLLFAGLTVGALVAALELLASGAGWSRARFASGAVIAGACAVAEFGVMPRIERLRVAIAGPLESLASDDPRRIDFGRLHGWSVAWLGLAMLAAVVALVLSSRTLQPRS
jgi:hypothetical protein